MMEPLEAFYTGKVVYIPLADRLMELRERGFGDLRDDRLTLSPFEAFYLVEKTRIRVFDEKRRVEISLRELFKDLSVGKSEIWVKYLVYRDLRDRGYIVREASKMDFEVYGRDAARRFISIIYEGREATITNLEKSFSVASKQKMELVLAVVDRRTDIVYYSLGKQEF